MADASFTNNKIKVLFLLEGFDKGGIKKVSLDKVNGLSPDKYDITVQTFWYGGHCQSQVNENIRVIPFFFKRYVRGIIRLIEYLPPKLLHRLFIREKYDIEIAASDGGAAKVISGSDNKKSRKICWVHMDVVIQGSMLKEFVNSKTASPIYGKFDKIACVSQACLDKFIEKFGNSYDTCVVYNPMPVEQIIQKAQVPFEYEKNDMINLVCVGRLTREKGFDRLIDACDSLVKNGYKSFRLHHIGNGICEDELKKQVNALGLDEYISFHGFSDNPYPYIKGADAFVLPSRNEAFPLVVGESLILGTPIISTECSGIREWMGYEDKYGYVVDNSTEGIYNGIKKILDAPELLDTFGKNCEQKKYELDFAAGLKKFEDVINSDAK